MTRPRTKFFKATELMMRVFSGIGFNIFNVTWKPTWWTVLIYVNWIMMFIRIFHHILTNDVTMIETTEATSMALTASQILLKYLVMVMNKTGFRRLFTNVENYYEKHLHDPSSRQIMAKYLQLTRKVTIILCIMYLTAGLEIVLFPFFVAQPHRLPFAYHFPGLPLGVPSHWWLNFLDHFVLTITVVCAFSAFDSFVIMLILHGCCRIEITAHMVRNIQPELQAPSRRLAHVLGQVVANHVDAKRYVVDFNTQMGFICLWEFVSASITVAMSLNVVASLEISSVGLILTSASLQMLIYCYFANILLVKCDELLTAAWEIDWYRMDCANQKMYCLFLMAAQLTLKVNAIFMAVGLETFVVVMRSSYQYFALLQEFS